MYAIFTILHHDSTYEFSWIRSSHAIDSTTEAPIYTSLDTSYSTCCLVGTTQLNAARRAHLQQQILTAAQRLSFGTEAPAGEQNDIFCGLGQLLFTQLIPEVIQQQLANLPAGSTLQLITDDLNWPWELLHDGKEFLALQHDITRLPCLEKAQPQRSRAQRSEAGSTKIACLLLGNPTSDLPGTVKEITAIEDILFVARERVTYRSLFGDHITADYLQDQFTTEHYDLIHYSGHATATALLLANAPFRVDHLGATLQHHPVVVLNACATAQAAIVDADLSMMSRNAQSLASSFIQAGAAAVIGMLWPIPDHAATCFGQVLYEHLASGESIGAALRLSRIELRRQDPQGIAWLAPVLYGNSQQQPFPVALKSAVGTVMAVRFLTPPIDGGPDGQRHPEVSARSLTKLVQRIAQYGGTVFHITESRLLASFDLYKLNDNSALTAIFAARDLMTQLATWQVSQPVIAIVSGTLSTSVTAHHDGIAGIPTTPLLLGTAVQEAEQLVGLATAGQLLINELAHTRSATHFHAQPWRGTMVGGGQLHAFELLSSPLPLAPASLALDFSVTVGRKAEQAQLQTIWQEVQRGNGQAIGISGEAGIGKSHLMQTLRRRIAQEGVHWLQVGCTIDMQPTSYGFLARLFRNLLAWPDDATDAQREDLLHARFANYPPTDVALVSDLLGMVQLESQRQERSVYQHQLSRLLIHLIIEKLAEMPLILVVEDAHWCDPASLEVLTLLANHLEDARVLFCLIYRPTWQPPWLGKAYFQTIPLKALGREERQALYKELLDTAQLPDELMALVERSSGNPLFLTEILMTLLHKGLLVPAVGSDKTWQANGILFARDLPDSVHRVIDLRLDQLAADTRDVLAMAAVLGTGFTPNMLTWGVALPQGELYAQLALLTEHDFLRCSLINEEYTFRHELIRDVVYLKIPPPQRQLWHRQVATALEEGDNMQREAVTLLAHHYYHSLIDGDVMENVDSNRTSDVTADLVVIEKAIRYLVRSGQDAVERYGGAEALTLFQRADMLLQRFSVRSSYREMVYRGLGDAYRLRNDFAAADAAYAEAHAALYRRPLTADARPQAASLARLLARLAMWRADYPTAEAWIESGLTQVANQVSSACQAGTAMLHIQMGSVCFDQGNYGQAVDHCETGLAIASVCRNEEAIAEGNHILGAALRKQGRYDLALACYQKSLAIHQRQKNLYQFYRVQMNIGIVHFHLSEWKRAIACYDEVLPFFREVDDQTMVASMHINIGLTQQFLGNWPVAEAEFQQALLISCEIQNQALIALTHCNLGTLYVLQESWQHAREHLIESLAILEKRGSKAYIADLKAHLALAAMAIGDWSQAHMLAAEAVLCAEEQGDRQYLAVALRCRGRIFLAQHDLVQALPCFKDSFAIFADIGGRYERERTRYWLAATYQQQGDWVHAKELYTKAMITFEELGAQQDFLMIKEALGQLAAKL